MNWPRHFKVWDFINRLFGKSDVLPESFAAKVFDGDAKGVAGVFEAAFKNSYTKTWIGIRSPQPEADGFHDHDRSLSIESWLNAVEYLARQETKLEESDFNYLWDRLEWHISRLKVDALTAKQWRTDAVLALFSFSTGPVSFLVPSSVEPKRQAFASYVDRDNAVPGLTVSQKVFLAGPRVSPFNDRPLDEYAKAVAEDTLVEGVHCLAGVRGAGKSTVLNRIEWYCRNWIVWRSPPPLLVRFDLGTSFESKRFLPDLMVEVCQRARSHCLLPPFSETRWIGATNAFIGSVGRWCQANASWAITIIVVATVVGAMGNFIEQPSSSTWPPPTTSPVITPQVTTLLTKNGYRGLLSAGFAIVLIGAAHYVASARFASRRASEKTARTAKLPRAPFLIIGIMGCAAAVLGLGNAIIHGTASAKAYGPYDLCIISCAIGLAILLPLMQMLLPSWWWAISKTDTIRSSLGSERGDRSRDVPGFSYIAAVARLLLPEPATQPDLRELDTPFQHQQVKELLKICTAEFGRVVLLIDDVDILPSKHFHELFRVLRPLSKVSKVMVIVCVPRFFFEAFKSDALGDVHSTVRQVYMLGDPAFFENKSRNFSSEKLSAANFRPKLAAAIRSRSRLRVNWQEDQEDGATAIKPVDFIVERWYRDLDDSDWDVISSYMTNVGASRRELIREIENILRDRDAKPCAGQHHATRRAGQGRVEQLKTAYHKDESSLLADVQERSKDKAAETALVSAKSAKIHMAKNGAGPNKSLTEGTMPAIATRDSS